MCQAMERGFVFGTRRETIFNKSKELRLEREQTGKGEESKGRAEVASPWGRGRGHPGGEMRGKGETREMKWGRRVGPGQLAAVRPAVRGPLHSGGGSRGVWHLTVRARQ